MMLIGWVIAGIIMLAITIYIHYYTCDYTGNRMPLPVGGLIIAIVLCCIPILNFILFLIGAITYIVCLYNNEISFFKAPKWYEYLVNILKYDLINKI